MDLITSSAGKRQYKDKLGNKNTPGYCQCDYVYFTGYSNALLTNYAYSEDIADNKAPFDHDQDLGSTSATTAITPSATLRMGSSFVADTNLTLKSLYGYITCKDTGSATVTLAICKVTPVIGAAANLTPVVLYEETFTSLDNNNLLIRIDSKTFANKHISKGDLVFTMVKGSSADDLSYWRTKLNFSN